MLLEVISSIGNLFSKNKKMPYSRTVILLFESGKAQVKLISLVRTNIEPEHFAVQISRKDVTFQVIFLLKKLQSHRFIR